jgi:hypothetical protein
MTTRRSEDLPPPLPANVRRFPFIIGPEEVLEIALRQREQATEKAVALRPSPRPVRTLLGPCAEPRFSPPGRP